MKTAGLIFLWLMAAAASAQTNQTWLACRNPIRVFDPRSTVDLTPLFQWWSRQPLVITNSPAIAGTNASPETDRPLAAWYRITGTRTATIGPSWVLNAVIYTSPTIHTNARIILNHPPAAEAATYFDLHNQLADNEQQAADVRQVYEANTNEEAIAFNRAEAYRRSWDKVAPTGVNEYSRLASEKHDAAATALAQLDQLQSAHEQIEQQMNPIPAANGMYQIDCFALEIGRSKQGLMIYDLGLMAPSPQP